MAWTTRNRSMMRLMDIRFLVGFTILAILFLAYENSTHNVSLENIQKGFETAYDKKTKSIKVHIMQ